MTRSDGKCKIEGVHVGEVAINLMGTPTTVYAKYALTTAEGSSCGAGNRNFNWSPATMLKLGELISAMEADIIGDVFESGATTSSVLAPVQTTSDDVPGL